MFECEKRISINFLPVDNNIVRIKSSKNMGNFPIDENKRQLKGYLFSVKNNQMNKRCH